MLSFKDVSMQSQQNKMHLPQDIHSFFQKYKLANGIDTRTQSEVNQHGQFVKQLTIRNFQTFQMELTTKRSIKYPSYQIKKIDLGDGIYCNITDNQANTQQTILTIHGAPGNCGEWAGLENQLKGKYRWINMAIPGMDGQDERRGAYDGTLNGFCDLFLRIVGKLKLKRVTICAHSFGSTVGLTLVESFPRIVEGFINIAGLTISWPFGMSYMYKSCIVDNGYFREEWKTKRMYEKDQHRESIYQDYVANYQQKQYQKTKIPLLNKLEYFSFLKLTFQDPQHFGQLFKAFQASSLIRVLAYARNDPLIREYSAQKSIYSLLRNSNSYWNQPDAKKHFKAIKQTLEKRVKEKMGVNIEGEKIQEYLCVLFDETGHNIHRRRPQELSRIIEIYLIALQLIHETRIIFNSSL